MRPIRVLMVCMGNICRSPMAEAVFRKMVSDAGLSDRIEVDSAGTDVWYGGDPAHTGTLRVLERIGIPYDGRSRQLQREDLDRYDYVLAMDRDNLRYIRRASGGSTAEIALFLSYARAGGKVSYEEVPDPYYDNSFDLTHELVTKGSEALLAHIRADKGI